MVLAIFGFAGLAWRGLITLQGRTLLLLLTGWGLLHLLTGRQGVYVHPWWWWPMTPSIVIAAALTVDALWRIAHARIGWIADVVGLTLLVSISAMYVTLNVHQFFQPANIYGDVNYTVAELGEAIQAAAPDVGAPVLLNYSLAEPAYWYYGDRPLKLFIWSPDDVERRQRDGDVDLPYGFEMRCATAAQGVVLFQMYADDTAELVEYLRVHYTEVPLRAELQGKFRVFRLHRRMLYGAMRGKELDFPRGGFA
jgi:hypothetical protein